VSTIEFTRTAEEGVEALECLRHDRNSNEPVE
jgi:hypothetical protein